MNSTLYTVTVLDAHRAADLAREVELLRVRRERSEAAPAGRRSFAQWLHAATHRPVRTTGSAAIASGR